VHFETFTPDKQFIIFRANKYTEMTQRFTAIGRVALDTRLGCLGDDIPSDSETYGILQSLHTFFTNVAEVELRTPFWRVWSTPTWKKYIGALDIFRE
jgi:cytochrome P450 family 49 subfamily A